MAGVITFFFIGWRTLLDGRFLQDTSVRFIGVTADVHSNWVGIVAAMAFIFGLFLFLKKSKSKCVFISGILTICIFLTGSRKAIMLAAIGLFISVFFIYPEKRLRKIFISIFLLMMGYFMIMSVPFLYKIAGSRIEATINYYLRGTGEDSSMSTRDYLITKGMIYIKENLKTGYGLNNYRLIANNYDLYSHNNFIEILFSSGIIGFCIYYSKYILLFIKLIIWRRSAILEVNVLRNILFCLFITMTVFEYWFVTYYERNFMIVHVIILSFLRIYKRPDKLLLTDNKT